MAKGHPYVFQEPNTKPVVTYIRNQVFKRNNCINSIWTGKPGSGKSWGMLSLFCLIDPNFKLKGNWFFKASELMKAIKSGDYPKGKIWGYDEAGIDLHNLKYFDEINKGINAFLQTSRHRNYIFGFTVPYMSLVSKGVRMLMNMQVQARGYRGNQTITVPRILDYNGELDKFYRKRLLVRDPNKKFHFLNTLELPKPPQRIIDEYEAMKKEFTSNLFENISDRIEAHEAKENKPKNVLVLTDRQKQVLGGLERGLTIAQIAAEGKCHTSTIHAVKWALQKKGFAFKPIHDGPSIISMEVIKRPNIEIV